MGQPSHGAPGKLIHAPAALLLVKSVAPEVELYASSEAHHPERSSEAADVPVTERELWRGTGGSRHDTSWKCLCAPRRGRAIGGSRILGGIWARKDMQANKLFVPPSRHGGNSMQRFPFPSPTPLTARYRPLQGQHDGPEVVGRSHLPRRYGRHHLQERDGCCLCVRPVSRESVRLPP